MKKGILKTFSCLGVIVFATLTLFACTPTTPGIDDSSLKIDESQSLINMTATVTNDKIELKIASDSKDTTDTTTDDSTIEIVALKAYQYLEGDTFSGVSQNIIEIENINDYIIGNGYKFGTEKTIKIDRYAEAEDSTSYDNLYNKYYLVKDGTIVKGPIYATEISSKYDDTPTFNIKSKKGLFADWNSLSAYKDLGASHTVINLPIETLIHPNEIFDENGEAVDLPLSEEDKVNYIEFTSNGQKYYFNKATIKEWDSLIKDYYDLGSQITAIIIARPNENDEEFPQNLTYAPYSTQGTSLMSLNTSNSYGFNYYIALIEFLANHYSENNFENGYISNFVIGNEIDYAKDYNRISEKQASIDTYMEEYSRLMRLTNLATRKYSKDITVSIPLTQAWAQKGYTISGDCVQAYAPKQMIEWLNTKTKMEGDYNWGLAPHVYGYHLAQSEVYKLDTYENQKENLVEGKDWFGGRNVGMTNNYNTTSKLTFSNLELLDDFLNQDVLKFGDNVRSVYLTESGVSSYLNGELYGGENIQAGIIASVYYKISQLDCIKAFSYYRAVDNEDEASSYAVFGLIKSDYDEVSPTFESKQAYNVYKYIDTQYSQFVANKYLQYIEYYNENQKLQKYNEGFTSYLDLLNLFDTSHDFSNFDWAKATPVIAEKVYEFEDKIDIGNINFESESYLYDGEAHSLSIKGELPEGVAVQYSENNSLTDVGTATITASFLKDGEIIATRVATLEVNKVYTNKKVYSIGEKIYVTAYVDSDITNDAWIGIYRENASLEKDPSLYWYSFNTEQDGKLRTVCIQEQTDNLQGSIIAGNYTICYFINGGYDVRYQTTITVKQSTKIDVDLTPFEFLSKTEEQDGQTHSILITNEETLPEGVTVSYENNTQTEPGSYQVKVNFILNNEIIETRYAVLTIEASSIDRLQLEKTTFIQGEDIMVTATAFANSENKTWWVGLYLNTDTYESNESIYWYYVKDENHINGTAYNIKEQTANSSRSDHATIPVGEYKIVLFNTSGYTVEETIDISIIASTSTETGTLSTTKETYELNENILVTANCPTTAGNETYWVGLYLANDNTGNVYSIYWYYVKDSDHTSGTQYNIKDQEANVARGDYTSLPAGKYKLVLFNTSNGVDCTVNFEITSSLETEQTSITTGKTQYKVNEKVFVTAITPDDGKYYWVGLYLDDEEDYTNTKSIYWFEVTNNSWETKDITKTIKNSERDAYANLPAGNYKLVLFNTSGYTVEKTISFTIVGA